MERSFSGNPNEELFIAVPTPSSLKSLPVPSIPAKDMREVEVLQRTLVDQSGLQAGEYATLDSGHFHQVKTVYDGLLGALIEDVDGLDIRGLSVSLYMRHEQFIGNMNKLKYYSIPDLMLADGAKVSVYHQRIWASVAEFTEAIRWLIELGIKMCQPTGMKVSEARLDRLIALARAVFKWDIAWEHVAHGVLPHELVRGPGFTASIRPTRQAVEAWEAYEKATDEWRVEADRQWLDRVLSPDKEVTLDDLDSLQFQRIREPMERELGYNMADWAKFSSGLIDSFAPTEYMKVIAKDDLGKFLSDRWGIDRKQFESLLMDHALSKNLVDGCNMDQLRPAEYARRDTRLLRRPVRIARPKPSCQPSSVTAVLAAVTCRRRPMAPRAASIWSSRERC